MDLLEVLQAAYDLARDAGDADLAHAIDGFHQIAKKARDERNMLSSAFKMPNDRSDTDYALLFDDAPTAFRLYNEFAGVTFSVTLAAPVTSK